ncbi:hypothetical protein [[Phormidium] sp. ETS-05]|nr:hypothetical protein [[Phormidium] sp. ETS-05]
MVASAHYHFNCTTYILANCAETRVGYICLQPLLADIDVRTAAYYMFP